MKVLVTYFSQSGNTEKIATAIWEQATLNNKAELKKIEEITTDNVAEYDLIFIGSPLHLGSLAAPVKECLSALQASPGQKLAAFITHSAPTYPDQDMEGFTEPIKATCKKKGIEYKGCFHCQGFLAESVHGVVQKKMNLTDEQWAGVIKEMTGRPNQEDMANAKAFAKKVLS